MRDIDLQTKTVSAWHHHIEPMLDGLDDIDWSSLEHAYGDAGDTPWHLRRLLSVQWRTRRVALRALHHSVYHQGGGYSSSPVVLPFLLELLGQPEVGQKALILDLVCALGIGGQYLWLDTGYLDPEARHGHLWQGDELTWFRQSHARFADAADLYLDLMQQRVSAAARAWAAFALAWLPEQAAQLTPQLQALYRSEKNPRVRASILLALGVLSLQRGAGARAELRGWLHALPALRPGLVGDARSVAILYALDECPGEELLNDLGRLVGADPYLRGFPWGHGRVAEIAALVLTRRARRHGWDVTSSFADEILALRRQRAALGVVEPIPPQRGHGWPPDDLAVHDHEAWLASCMIQVAFPAAVAQEDGPAGWTASQRAALALIARQPALLHRPGRELDDHLEQLRLPTSARALATALGWLPPEEEPAPLGERVPSARALPDAIADDERFDVRAALSSSCPFSPRQLRDHHRLLDLSLVSRNPNVAFGDDVELLTTFAERWSWWDLTQNPALRWTAERITDLRDHLSWRALSARPDLPWTEDLIAEHADRWDWDGLSSNPGLPWSTGLIERYADLWTWHLLSQNPALPWSDALLRRFSRRWTWVHLSRNSGLPWSLDFLARHRRKIDGCGLGSVTTLPWSVDLIEQLGELLTCWGNLSANPGLPWSIELIRRYLPRWNWSGLSRNPALPWSGDLLSAFADRWDWTELIRNTGIDWTRPDLTHSLRMNAHRISGWWLRYEHGLPWALLIDDPAFAHAITPEDRRLFEQVIRPRVDDALTLRLLAEHHLHQADDALATRAHLLAHLPPAPVDLPDPPALFVVLGAAPSQAILEHLAGSAFPSEVRERASALLVATRAAVSGLEDRGG